MTNNRQEPTPAQLQKFRIILQPFAAFRDEEWDVFAQSLYCRAVPKRKHFVSAGELCSEIGAILQGSFRFFFVKADGVEVSSYFTFEGELATSYAAFLKRSESPITIEAMEDSVLICFDYEGLQAMLADERLAYRLERMGRLIAEYLICCYEERVMTFLSQTPEQRYQRMLTQTPELAQRVPQHYIANYLGVTPVSLSRIRQRIAAHRPGTRAA